ncbi:MAG: P-II family nitrogen regulator, partial [Planctomycetota bacterium]
MKLIIAYIQPHKLEDVKKALAEADVGKMSVTNSLGCGAQMGYEESYRGIKFEV